MGVPSPDADGEAESGVRGPGRGRRPAALLLHGREGPRGAGRGLGPAPTRPRPRPVSLRLLPRWPWAWISRRKTESGRERRVRCFQTCGLTSQCDGQQLPAGTPTRPPRAPTGQRFPGPGAAPRAGAHPRSPPGSLRFWLSPARPGRRRWRPHPPDLKCAAPRTHRAPSACALLALPVRGFETGHLCPAFKAEDLGVLTLAGHISQGSPSDFLVGDAFLYESFDVKCKTFRLGSFQTPVSLGLKSGFGTAP